MKLVPSLLLAFGLLIPLAPAAVAAPPPEDEDEAAEVEEEEQAEEEEPADDELFYSDGFETLPEDEVVDPDAEGTYIWGLRSEDNGIAALAFDILNDNLPATYELSPWDTPMHDEERFAPTEEEIQAKIGDEEYSPLKEVLTDGPVNGLEVPIFVLVPDTVLEGTGATAGIPNAATYKAMRVADELTNGIAFTYTTRTDSIQFEGSAQQVIPQLQYIDVEVYQGVVKFFFNLGMDSGLYNQKTGGRSYQATATAPAKSIADGYDLALERALQAAVRKAIGAAVQASGMKTPDTVKGRIDYYQIANEGWWAETEEFEVTVKAYITVNVHTGQPAPMLSRPGSPAIVEIGGSGEGDSESTDN
ncbi:MAG TPA: hypothetical protein VEI97_12045 [bacterium]|nr:hypothetical protein [bacterium]